jgi:hypothetical protein
MHQLDARDWKRLHRASLQVFESYRSLAECSRAVVETLEQLIPARRISTFEFHLPGRLVPLYESAPQPFPERRVLLWSHSREIPFLPAFRAGRAEGPARLLEHLTRAQWRSTVLYNEWLREAGTEDFLSMLTGLSGCRRKLSLSFERDGRGCSPSATRPCSTISVPYCKGSLPCVFARTPFCRRSTALPIRELRAWRRWG